MTAVHALQAVCALHSVYALHAVYALYALRASLSDRLRALPVVCIVQVCDPLTHPGKIMPDFLHLQRQPDPPACSLCTDCICAATPSRVPVTSVSCNSKRPSPVCTGDEDDDASVELSSRASALLHVGVFSHEPRRPHSHPGSG